MPLTPNARVGPGQVFVHGAFFFHGLASQVFNNDGFPILPVAAMIPAIALSRKGAIGKPGFNVAVIEENEPHGE